MRSLTLILSLALALVSRAAEKPNILFVFADDQCYKTIHALNNDEIETPNLDRLVAAGTTFTHAYNMGSWSGAVCVASRCMLMTGRNLWHANAIYNKTADEAKAGRFWPVQMRKAGYRTYFTGKWHVRAKAEEVFDVARHVRPGMPNQTPAGYSRPLADGSDTWDPADPKFGGFWKGGRHWSAIVADDAIEYLGTAAKEDDPFFMYIAFNAPHDPRQAPQEYLDKYPADKIEVPASYLPEYPYKDAIGCSKGLRDEKLAPFPRTKPIVQVHRREYYAIITHMDAQIGRILEALEKSGKRDNTWIFFSADHGLAVGNHGLFGKQNLYDHSTRVPFIVVGPGVAADKKRDAPVYLQDFMATGLDLAGIEKPEHVAFHSIRPLLEGKPSPYDAIYGAYLQVQRSVTMDGWKLLLYPKIKKVRLYDLRHDPEELKDRADEPSLDPVKQKLFARLLKLQKETGDTLDLKTPFAKLVL